MERVDINHDGSIQLTEFVAGLVDWKALQTDSQWAHWVQLAFERLDRNGDGWLGLEELMAELPADDGSTAAERTLEARRMLREADTNGDGRIRCVRVCVSVCGGWVGLCAAGEGVCGGCVRVCRRAPKSQLRAGLCPGPGLILYCTAPRTAPAPPRTAARMSSWSC